MRLTQVTLDRIQTQYSRLDERNETLGVMLAQTISERGLREKATNVVTTLTLPHICSFFNGSVLVIPHKSARLRESDLLDACTSDPSPSLPLRASAHCAQDDSLQGICHPERSEGSRADLWAITRSVLA